MLKYGEFRVRIGAREGDTYPVEVLNCPLGSNPRSSFCLPEEFRSAGGPREDLAQVVRASQQPALRDAQRVPAPAADPKRIGQALFDLVFSGPVGRAYSECLGQLQGTPGAGLRITLDIGFEPQSGSGLAEIAALPWEFLYDRQRNCFMVLSRLTPIVRHLAVHTAWTRVDAEQPLRILAVMSSPRGYAHLQLADEKAKIKEGLERAGRGPLFAVDFLEEATLPALHARLQEADYHVLHFMGHGGVDQRTGKHGLVWEGPDESPDVVTAEALANQLRETSIRCACLNACGTAQIPAGELDPSASVASALVVAGVPAVVAMQFPISDVAAVAFARGFYTFLAQGSPVDAALCEGRQAIQLARRETLEWATPVLFMQTPEVFRIAKHKRVGLARGLAALWARVRPRARAALLALREALARHGRDLALVPLSLLGALMGLVALGVMRNLDPLVGALAAGQLAFLLLVLGAILLYRRRRVFGPTLARMLAVVLLSCVLADGYLRLPDHVELEPAGGWQVQLSPSQTWELAGTTADLQTLPSVGFWEQAEPFHVGGQAWQLAAEAGGTAGEEAAREWPPVWILIQPEDEALCYPLPVKESGPQGQDREWEIDVRVQEFARCHTRPNASPRWYHIYAVIVDDRTAALLARHTTDSINARLMDRFLHFLRPGILVSASFDIRQAGVAPVMRE